MNGLKSILNERTQPASDHQGSNDKPKDDTHCEQPYECFYHLSSSSSIVNNTLTKKMHRLMNEITTELQLPDTCNFDQILWIVL